MAVDYKEFGATLPILDALKNPRNTIFLCLGLFFLVDFATGSLLAEKFVFLQFKILKVDYHKPGFKFMSILGTYTDTNSLARMYDKIAFIGCFIVCGASYMFNLWATFRRK
jgi:hypothetical protein